MNSDLAPRIYDIALYDRSARYMQLQNKPNRLTNQFTVLNGKYAKLLTMYKRPVLYLCCLHEMVFKLSDSQIKYFFSNVNLF